LCGVSFIVNYLLENPMFHISVRVCGGSYHYATADNLSCALTLFHALTKTFTVVELRQGTTLVSSYNNA